jgi:hypothetical protein
MLCKHMKPTSLKTPPHCSAIWYSNCWVLEVNQNRVKLDGVARIALLSSSENHPKHQKGAKVARRIGPAFLQGQGRCQEGNCDVVFAEAAKCQVRDHGSLHESVEGPGKRR